jgi:fibronectin type 3 domain-containing protein
VRVAAVATLSLLLLLAGCGYIGPIVPPSPDIPTTITDLAIVERGKTLVVTCTGPRVTTDSLPLKHFSAIELQIGPDVQPFDFERWSATAKQYLMPAPAHLDPDDLSPIPLKNEIPISDWPMNSHLVAFVRSAEKHDRYSSWSNRVVFDILPPLDPPVPGIESTAQGIKLTWTEQRPGLHYVIFRQGPNDKTPTQVGTADTLSFVDSTSQYETPYTYTVIAKQDSAESLPGTATQAPFSAKDTFPPNVPTGVQTLAAANSIEVSWERNSDADLKGYYVFRSVNGGPLERQGDLVTVPSFSDRKVERGKSYRYAVSATDQLNHESEKSAASAEIAY